MPLGSIARYLLVARWGSLTPFESQLGLNARIEEWEHRSVRVICVEERILLRKITASMLRRFNALAKIEAQKKGGEHHLRLSPPRFDFGSSQRSGRTSALPYPLLE